MTTMKIENNDIIYHATKEGFRYIITGNRDIEQDFFDSTY